MALSLSGADLFRIETASRTLLSPLAAPDIDAWRLEAMRALCDLFDAEAGLFLLPGQPRPSVGYQIDEAALRKIDDYITPTWTETGVSPDPVVEQFYRIAVEQRFEAWDLPAAVALLRLHHRGTWESAFYREVLAPQRMGDAHALFAPRTHGAAHLTVHGFRRGAPPGENLPLLRVLLPAFKAGLDALDRLAAHRDALDAVSEPLAVYNADGRELHRNRALCGLLEQDPERARLTTALAALAFRVRPLGFPRSREGGRQAPVSAEVQTAGAVYTLRAALLGPGSFGPEGAFLITVASMQRGLRMPAAAEVQARNGLSRREAEIALLVAEGLSNEEIGGRLHVSRHTVRHHVESVMSKLGLQGRGRASVASRLLQAS